MHAHGDTPSPEPSDHVPLEQHLADVIEHCVPLPGITVRTSLAAGFVLAAPAIGRVTVPRFRTAAMDGFALRGADLATDRNVARTFRIVGEVPAGSADNPVVRRGEAVRIMTGARIPDTADTVAPIEQVEEQGAEIVVRAATRHGAHVRLPGEDVTAGTELLPAGRRLASVDVGLLTASGVSTVVVHPIPRVAVVPTGDELVPDSHDADAGGVHDANGPMLAALVAEAGAQPVPQPIVPDNTTALDTALVEAANGSNLVLCTGGASVGRYDLLGDVLAHHGSVRAVHVGLKPGSPQVLGTVSGVPVLGLPGNPVAAYVSFLVFGLPAIARLAGRTTDGLSYLRATAATALAGRPGRRTYLRVNLEPVGEGWHAHSAGPHGSHVLSSLSASDGLAVVPPEGVPPGQRIEVIPLPGRPLPRGNGPLNPPGP